MPEANAQPANRIPLLLEVEYKRSYSRTSERAKIRNISSTGAFIEHGQEKLNDLDKVNIILRVGGRERTVPATVIWSNEIGAGVRFLPSNNRDVQIVDDLIYYVESQRETRRNILRNIFKQVS